MGDYSLNDRAVKALTELDGIKKSVSNEHPLRHIVWDLEEEAANILSTAFQAATRIAYRAKQIAKDYDEAHKQDAEA